MHGKIDLIMILHEGQCSLAMIAHYIPSSGQSWPSKQCTVHPDNHQCPYSKGLLDQLYMYNSSIRSQILSGKTLTDNTLTETWLSGLEPLNRVQVCTDKGPSCCLLD